MPIITKTRINEAKGPAEHRASVPGVASLSAAGLSANEQQRIMSLIAETQVERVATKDLKVNAKNARRHPQKQVKLIAQNIRAFGFTTPLLIDQDNNIIAGHGRYAAALQLGLPQVPAIRLTHRLRRETGLGACRQQAGQTRDLGRGYSRGGIVRDYGPLGYLV